MSGLSEEQKKRIEENKRKALQRLNQSKTTSSPIKRPFPGNSGHAASSISSTSGSSNSFYKNNSNSNNNNNNSNNNNNNNNKSVNNFKARIQQWARSPVSSKNPTSSTISSNTSHSTSFNIPTSASTSASTSAHPKGYFSPPKNKDKVHLKLSMKNSMWFRVDNERKHNDGVRAVAQKVERRQFTFGTWCFHIQDYQTVIEQLKNMLDATIEHIPSNVVRILQKAHTSGKQAATEEVDLSPIGSELVDKLMAFQKEGLRFGVSHGGRFLLADDMGLGKTVQAVCLCAYYKAEWPVLVICPSSVKMSWHNHFLTWLPHLVEEEDVNVINIGKDDPTLGKINIISYHLASKAIGTIYRKSFKVVVADECHFLKNHMAQRTKNLVPLLQGAKRAILLSGTPALSRPKELFTQIKALDQSLFPKYQEFSERYCDAKQKTYGWDDNGCSNEQELQAILSSTLMVRRMKEDVLDQLPEKRRQIVVLDPAMIKNTKSLMKEERMFKDNTQDRKSALLNFFQKSCESKLKGVQEYVAEKLECGVKMIVFAHHTMMLDAVEETAIVKKVKYIRIDGGTNQKRRQAMVDTFNEEADCRIAVLSLTACGTGLNIVGSSNIIFAELYWNPGHLKQAEDRAYRIGQKNCVLVTYLVAHKTADDYIWPMVQSKLKVLTNLGVGTEKGFEGKTTKQDKNKQKSVLDFFEKLNEEDDISLLEGVEEVEEKRDKTNGTQESSQKSLGAESVSDNFDDLLEDDDLFNDSIHDDMLNDSISDSLLCGLKSDTDTSKSKKDAANENILKSDVEPASKKSKFS